ncbi:MAG: hypothetical protein LUC30_02785 [Clostridiales bacterium]|nr:hypothetical protein [Clostridiales bacterium]
MLKKWLDNDPKPTLVCACISVVSLVFSLGGWLKDMLPIDTAWVAIVLCGIPIVVGAVTALITEHDVKADVLVSIPVDKKAGDPLTSGTVNQLGAFP